MVDAHCHVFNASDLPTTRFLRQVVFEDFPKQSAARILAVRDPDVTDEFIALLLKLLGTGSAPTADEEIAFLETGRNGKAASLTVDKARAAAVEDTSQHLLELDRKRRRIVTMADPGDLSTRSSISEEKFLNYMLGDPIKTLCANEPLTIGEARAASQRAFLRQDPVGRYLNWFSLFRLYRHVLVDRLVADSKAQGFNPLLLTPALVDYDEWLYEDVDSSPLPRQMVVMDRISQRMAKAKSGPVVHGYMGFDPLREVAFRKGKSSVSSLATAHSALMKHGFIGIKLYPPMGFRPEGNQPPYPERTVKSLGFEPNDRRNRVASHKHVALR